jgi:hypothetical protein
MPDAATMWFKQHPKATAALAVTLALAILGLVSISSFGTPSGW